MRSLECAREHEVLAAVLSGRLPGSGDGELGAHAGQCAVCGEALLIAVALREDSATALEDVRVPPAAQVWWRAALRARLEAAQAAARPITWIHGLMGASAAGVICAAIGLAWPSVREAAGWILSRVWAVEPPVATMAALVGEAVLRGLPIAAGIGACLVLAPLALYFALADEWGVGSGK